MTYYATVRDVPAPVAFYDATHTEGLHRTAGQIDGLVVHLCRATDSGFQITEVWTDQAAHDKAHQEILAPILAEQAAAGPGTPSEAPPAEEFTVRGLIVPGSGIAV
jgi:hypothetical protein